MFFAVEVNVNGREEFGQRFGLQHRPLVADGDLAFTLSDDDLHTDPPDSVRAWTH